MMRFVNASENTSVTIPVKITVSERRTAIHAKSPPTSRRGDRPDRDARGQGE